uniref:Dynein axonemal assembly factor 6 n=1 Tax=Coturnix japonica TaxID=93934 RepID=A0A8C2TE01_COTJA
MDVDVSSASSLQSLARLLSDTHEDEDDNDFGVSLSCAFFTVYHYTLQLKPEHNKSIWSMEEVPEGSEFDDTWDPREQPEYEILFKQHVGTEDVFFGMSRKDPSTACCEDMVKIKLPETKFSDITLDIQDKVLDLRTPQKKLLLHLPCPVDSKKGKARFLSEEELLEVTLRMRREFDFINFA